MGTIHLVQNAKYVLSIDNDTLIKGQQYWKFYF